MASQLLCDLDTQQTVYVTSDPRRTGRVGPCGRGAAQQWTAPPPPGGATGSGGPWRSEGDTSDSASLLWLLDYRLDHLLSPGGAVCGQQTQQYQSQHHHHHHHQDQQQHRYQQYQPSQQQHYQTQPQEQPQFQHDQQQQYHSEQQQRRQQNHPERHQQQQSGCVPQTRWDATSLQTGPRESGSTPQEQTQEVQHSSSRDAGGGKPPFTYTELIEQALVEERQLTVSGIYRWITSHFGFYKSCDDRWKNSVRHNLSMNPYFRKGSKSGSGSGHLWTLADVEGRRVRRCHTAARMGRPTHAQGEGDGAAVEATAPAELQLCEDIPSPSQEIWLCSSPPEGDPKPATPAPATDAGFILQYCTFTPEVAATVELSQAESVDCELNNNDMGGICMGDQLGESQLSHAQFRSNHQLTNNDDLSGVLTRRHHQQLTTGLFS